MSSFLKWKDYLFNGCIGKHPWARVSKIQVTYFRITQAYVEDGDRYNVGGQIGIWAFDWHLYTCMQ